MLTNDQCIEIAEKVWGWPMVQVKGTIDLWHIDLSDDMYDIHSIRNKVNSWSGFGRTVEAMAENGWYFQEVDFWKTVHLGFVGDSAEKFCVEWDPEKPKELIEATHLAALEAITHE